MIASTTMRAAATCALLATTCLSTFVLASPALAQNTDTPSAYKNIDENGVDLTDGSFNFSMVEGSIGSGEGLLSLIRYDAGGSSLDNWEGLALRIEGGVATVSLGDRSETFSTSGSGFVPEQGNGATLTGGDSYYSYRNASGTEIVFASPTGAPSPVPAVSCGPGVCDLAARTIREPNGKTVSLTWEVEAAGRRLLEVSNNLGYAMRVAYNPGGIVNGQPTDAWFDRASVTFRNNMMPGSPTPTVTYAKPTPAVTEVTDTGGRTWRITTDAQNRIVAIKRPGAATDSTQVAYGANGVAQVTHEGVTTSYSRALISTGSMTTVSDAVGTRRTVVSNLASGRPTQVNDAFGFATLYGYDANDRLTEVTAPEGNKRLTTYDARGDVTKVIARAKPGADGSPSLPDIITEAGYDLTCNNAAVCNQPRWTTDAAGATTDYGYDALGNVTSVKSPLPAPNAARPETRYTYEALDAPLPGSDITMLTAVSACPSGASCDPANEVRTTLRYSLPNLQLGAVETGAGDGSLKALTQLGYDEIGNVTAVDGPLPGTADTTRTFYNASREVVGTIGPDPDGAGALKHRAQLITRNADGDITDTYTGTATAQNGRIAALIDANGNKTSYAYDGHDRVSRTSYPAQAAPAGTSNPDDYEQLTYDARSLVTQVRLRDGRAIDLGYDGLGRLVSKDVPGDNWVWETDGGYAYDNLGRLTRASAGSGQSITFGYDALGRKTVEANSYYGATYSAYDLAGRRTRLTYHDGFSVGYDYFVTGEMKSIAEGAGAAPVTLATFAYDDRGRRTSLTRGNGTATTYAYDLGSRLKLLNHDLAGTSYDQAMTFAYNPASQIVENGRSNDLFAAAPAVTDLLSPVNGLNQLTSVGGSTVAHDARGNLTAQGGRTFGYTAENRLANVSGPSSTQLAYDPLGRLFHMDGSATDFLYDGSEIIGEKQAYGGGLRKRFVHGPGVDEPLVVYDASGAKRWFHADERGSIIATSDAAGAAATVHRYDEYGIPQDSLGDRFGYTGQMWLPEVGVYSYKARMYDPQLGRFLQSDPIGYADGMNLYAYVGGDPVNYTDSSGLNRDPDGDGCDGIRGVDYDVCGRRARPNVEVLPGGGGGPSPRPGFGDGGGGGAGPSVRPTLPTPQPQRDPSPDKRRDNCGNPLPPASRNYTVPPGFAPGRDPQNRFVNDGRGRSVENPYYRTAFSQARGGRGTGLRGFFNDVFSPDVLLDLAIIGVASIASAFIGPVTSARSGLGRATAAGAGAAAGLKQGRCSK